MQEVECAASHPELADFSFLCFPLNSWLPGLGGFVIKSSNSNPSACHQNTDKKYHRSSFCVCVEAEKGWEVDFWRKNCVKIFPNSVPEISV